MKLAIIGSSGQLARAVSICAAQMNIEAQTYDRAACDLTHSDAVIETFIDSLNVDAVIIAAAYTAVDAAEDNYETALAVNSLAPAAIAKACARRDIALIHISTDYVFSGKASTPYGVDAVTDPINAYGRTKYLGEQAVLKTHKRAAVLRTSWVFDGSGKNFMTTMLRVGAARDQLSVVNDQIGRPTYAAHLAQACLNIAKALLPGTGSAAGGLYHVTGSGEPVSWAGFASAIFERAKHDLPRPVSITHIPTTEYPTPAARPAYSVLDLSRYEAAHGALPHWREGLEQGYKDWIAASH